MFPPMAEDVRARLRRLMTERRLNMKELSLAAGLGETAVRDILIREQDPKHQTSDSNTYKRLHRIRPRHLEQVAP